MENKIREYWLNRLKHSRASLSQKCQEYCKQESVPKYTTPTLHTDVKHNFDNPVILTYKCVQDGLTIVSKVKEILLQTSKLKDASVEEKWVILQMLSNVLVESNQYLSESTDLYSSLITKKSSDTHQIALAKTLGYVLAYRLLLNDTIQHEPQIELFLSKAIEVVSTTRNIRLLGLMNECNRVLSDRQNLKHVLNLADNASRDIIWCIKYGLRDVEFADFSWMFGLVSGLMILKGNKYGKLCREMTVSLDTQLIVSWGPYCLTVTDFVKMFQLKMGDRSVQDKV